MKKILVIDFGSQYTQLIARRLRELCVYSEVCPWDEVPSLDDVEGFILSGGPESSNIEGNPTIHQDIFDTKKPILGICYGMQVLSFQEGGKVINEGKKEFGYAELNLLSESKIFENTDTTIDVWMSHGDKVDSLPAGYEITASSPNSPIAAFQNQEKKYFGLQFHPEVTHTKYGKDIIKNFVDICGVVQNWDASDILKQIDELVSNEVKDNNIIAGFFLDSTRSIIPTLDEIIMEGSLSFKNSISNYDFTTVRKLKKDIKEAIKNNTDDNLKKDHKKAQAKLSEIERNFQIILNLYNNNMIDEQRPLSFFPNNQRLVVGVEDKGTDKLIVPFEFVGKKLFYGLTATGTSDLNPMPFDPRYPMVGLHANALNTILDNKIIHEVSKVNVAIIIILFGLFLSFAIPFLSPAMGGLAIVVILSFYGWLSFWLFSNQYIWLDMVGPLLTLVLGYLGITVYNYVQEEKNKQFLKESFGTYVSPELIDQMYESGEEPSLGGEEGYHTAFFTDIQSFSAFSEKLTASELVALLNQYLTDMTDVLLENNGTLDKYIGDAIVAFYGAPIDVKDHELWACRTAIKMQENLGILRKGWQAEGNRWPEIVHNMQNRIGISSGNMVTGNMGSESRMNYTMMGDNVNTAARLESSAKQYGIYIQIADSTYQPVKDKVVVRDLDYVRVMGKNEPVKVFELISEVGQEPENYKKILPAYHEALNLYKNQEWEKAIEAFKASDELEDMFPGRKTNPSRIYIPRCEHFTSNSPGDDWDGVWTLTSK